MFGLKLRYIVSCKIELFDIVFIHINDDLRQKRIIFENNIAYFSECPNMIIQYDFVIDNSRKALNIF